MGGHGEKLSRKWEAAIAALLSESSIEKAAAKAGVAPRTLKSWLAQPAFAGAFRDARTAVLERVTGRLLAACDRAVEVLEAELSADKSSDRIRAAAILLAHARGTHADADIESRLRELEACHERGNAA
jgi:hypothetical protein